ncbi:nucleotidyltransferase domain-containing protein [Methanosphaera sp. ISO3-F5]|uniref:nucleotidyltransferase domain-containing protein n=1 Tax=Methanosphaera sp. ISO3-F5 TaxID=1452353 RepID=UPI002B25C0DF|nr:nucleotidyltransferase domain-containing protein [Methanosphaera sp. ISO3-F5]WQH63690.1 nucleotidyltransferase domain-containing protein [Methanosphaera sp. ISO3-F5]
MQDRFIIAKEFAEKIKSEYIKKIILFGSVARKEDEKDSDIDILIISNHREKIQNIIDDEIAWIMYDKQELISAHIMDEDLFNQTKNFTFLTNVLKDGVIIG